MRLLFTILGLFVCASTAAAQTTNPCDVPLPSLSIVTPTVRVVATWDNYDALFDGQPVWTETDLAVFPRGADPQTTIQVAGITVAKSAWTLQPNTADCYGTPAPFLFGVQPNVEYDLYVRAKNAEGPGDWSAPLPFGRRGRPAAPSTVRVIR